MRPGASTVSTSQSTIFRLRLACLAGYCASRMDGVSGCSDTRASRVHLLFAFPGLCPGFPPSVCTLNVLHQMLTSPETTCGLLISATPTSNTTQPSWFNSTGPPAHQPAGTPLGAHTHPPKCSAVSTAHRIIAHAAQPMATRVGWAPGNDPRAFQTPQSDLARHIMRGWVGGCPVLPCRC